MNILVTGGAGYIGSHTCVELLQSGHDVVVVDNLSNSSRKSIKRIEEITDKKIKFYEIDILDDRALNLVFNCNKIDAVIHFAGFKEVQESTKSPLKYYGNNITGTVVLCDVMNRHNVKRIVFSSSGAVYGGLNTSPLTENLEIGAKSPYAMTKVYIEQILSDLYESDNEWSISILRYFNPIGAHKSGIIGQGSKNKSDNIMSCITQVAIGKIKRLTIYGNDYNTNDGTGIRDYIHVVDLAKGHVKAAEYIFENNSVEVINLGTGSGHSVLDLIQTFKIATNVNIPYEITDRRCHEPDSSYVSNLKAKEILGWEPEKSLGDMCRDSLKWQLNNPDGYL